MAKRFTETKKWEDPWFQDLSPLLKCAWAYILDHCDNAGVWVVNTKMAEFSIGSSLDWGALLEEFAGRVTPIDGGKKWWVRRFIEFQYGRLSRDCKPHLPILALLEKHGISLSDVSQSSTPGKTHNVSAGMRAKVLARDSYECAYCGKTKDPALLVIDHVVPRKKGGDDKPKNLVAACIPCNSKKSDLLLAEFCLRYQLDFDTISQRVSERVSRRVKNTLQEEDRDREEEEDQDLGDGGSGEEGPREAATPLTVFDQARRCYPGTKRGLSVEWVNFTKKHPNFGEIVPLLLPAITREREHKAALKAARIFCPEWKNFGTWLNQSCWTQEFPPVEASNGTNPEHPSRRESQAERNARAARENWGDFLPVEDGAG